MASSGLVTTRLAWESGSDDHDVAVSGARVVSGSCRDADGSGVGFCDRAGLEHVERFAGGRAIQNVGEDNVGEFEVDDSLSGSRADEAAAYYGYLFSAHGDSTLLKCC